MIRALLLALVFAGTAIAPASVEAAKPHAAKVTKHHAKAKKVAKKARTRHHHKKKVHKA